MMNSRNMYSVGIFTCLGLVFCWWLIAFNKATINNTPQNEQFSNVVTSEATAQAKLENVATNKNQVQKNASFKEVYGVFGKDPVDTQILDQWQVERGYRLASLASNEYASYSDETLNKLVKDGDVNAMLALAERYASDKARAYEFGLPAAAALYYKAAVYGSTASLQQLSIIQGIRGVRDSDSAETQRAGMLEAIAITEVAALRGDLMPIQSSLRKYEDLIQFSESDFEWITLRGQEMYNELQQQRNELGLGSFNNAIPDAVNRFFASQYKFHESQKTIQYRYAQYQTLTQK